MSDETQGGEIASEAANENETAAELEQSASPDESTAEGQEVENEPVAKTFTQAELDNIVQREKAKAEAKASRKVEQTYREMLDRVPQRQQEQQQRPAEPKREQFASDADWIDAKVERKLAERDAQSNSVRQQQQHAAIVQKSENLYAQAEKVPGFDREAFEELPLTPLIANALIESDVAPKLMAYMAANPGEVERISKLSEARQGVELGKLELKVSAAPVKTSKAPAPISPIGGGKGSGQSLQSASMDDYYAMRMKQKPSWAR